ncbi:MAG TPA: Nif3-like dinuclear metal center hexameric protein [Chthonomonadaceae bacterium]|nr:Nif3-like dinuclear metal center hexameric protein [Chthonomonadaceae bacterium]
MARKRLDLPEERTRRRRRAVNVGEIIEFLEYLAPPSLSSPPAPYGLQVGTALAPVKSVILSPLPGYQAISCAAAYKSALLVTAAPLLTAPVESLRWDDPLGARITHLAQRQISLYALANANASAPGGFDDSLADRLGLGTSGVLIPTAAEGQLKLVVFVPPQDLARVRKAAAETGAGVIGAYTHCSFRTLGKGTFLPGADANPTVGKAGRLEEVEEARLEMLVPERDLSGVLTAVLEAHPYEEVAYDLYPLRNPGIVYGRGRISELPLQVSLDTVLAQVNDALGLGPDHQARCSHRSAAPIGSLAVASGASTGESLLWAAQRLEAGAMVIGGVTLTDLMLADGGPTVLIDVGFAPSVAPGLQRLSAQIRDTFDSDGIQVVYAP